MSEEYRLSVGIDANGAAEGAATFKSATLEIQRSAEDAIDSVSKLEEGLRKVTTATDGTKVTEITRDLTSFSKAADEGAEKADDLGASVSRVGSSYGDAGERHGISGQRSRRCPCAGIGKRGVDCNPGALRGLAWASDFPRQALGRLDFSTSPCPTPIILPRPRK